VVSSAGQLVSGLVSGLIAAIPQIIAATPQIIMGLIDGLLQGLESLYTTGDELIGQVFDAILSAIPQMLDAGWHELMRYTGISECTAAQSVTLNAARSLQLFDRGELAPKCRADIAVFEKGTNRPLLTVCNGNIVFSVEDYKVKSATEGE